MTNANAFYVLQSEYIDAALDEIVKQYGSIKRFIDKGLGIDDKVLETLRDELLEKSYSRASLKTETRI